jgi:ubiquinone/menaquinone biosynthesis C-methylase UbiE
MPCIAAVKETVQPAENGQLAESARPSALRRTLTPMNDQDSAATQTTWTNEAAEKWLSRIDGIERSGAPIRELLMERAHLQPGEQVLDVGCGSGPSTAVAAAAVHPGGMVTGIDIAAPMIAAARQRVRGRDIEWIVGDAETYPLPEGHYDAIISQMGLMFFTNNAKAFANLARACRAGGRLVGVVWPTRDKISTFRFLFNSVRQTLDRLHIAYQEPPLDFGPFSLGDAPDVKQLLGESGWTEIQIEEVERPMTMAAWETSIDQQSAVEWLHMGPANALLEGQPENVHAQAANDWVQAVKQRATEEGLQFDVLLHVITAKRP